uniref:Uncharacterized protein n=1 Tax=Latimeria chalumnae TaxID=7897 RepID=H3ADP7_LATCH
AGIAPPSMRQDAFSKKERQKQVRDPRHPLHGHIPPPKRLKSRKSFASENPLPQNTTVEGYRATKWREMPMTLKKLVPSEQLPPGKYWCTLNQAKAGVAKTDDNMTKWKLRNDPKCECGEPRQTLEHCLMQCPLSSSCTPELFETSDNTRSWLQFWSDK